MIEPARFDRSKRRTRVSCVSISVLALMVQGCATLPASGPTAHAITSGAKHDNPIGFKLEEVGPSTLADIAEQQVLDDTTRPTLRTLAQDGRNDLIGPGDVLGIGVYEVGVGLFGVNRAASDTFDPSARGETFDRVVVDQQGMITLPYVGAVKAAGHTTTEIQAMIVKNLRGLSQNPQAVVFARENVSNTVYVSGDVHKAGRMMLTLQRERLLDAIALAGGAVYSSEDTIVRVNRGSRSMEERLGRIEAGSPDDIVLNPGDRVELVKHPRSFVILGATGKVSQIPFEVGETSLAEAIARASGPSDGQADPSAIFIFRYVRPANDPSHEQPMIYRLNMLKPASYFYAQRFAVHDKDIIYFANAAANQPAKLISIINQLFTPAVTAKVLTQ
ncbi:polysaccharide export outer membrane protein [Sphingomonas vulcanisoli]|uniref:Polysaccharide export outer membrane protein n=1 Tax=Sphingomonas vulcanisoli TaxID=1658060 RepID=A0ABX0TVA1_9SPHN|nr:polysaccharide biosynthesis/export family protein [Sphingomonas vulcanisoli]NIJ09459.1 polysaccharide export outer membrane protein [Sphingomonas vulcanisoli]